MMLHCAGAPSPTRGSALPPMWTSDRISPAKKAKASLEPEETSSAVVADKDKEIERLRIAVCTLTATIVSATSCGMHLCQRVVGVADAQCTG